MKSKAIEQIVIGLVIAATCTASAAIVKVSVLESDVKTYKELLLEVRQDVKDLLKNEKAKR